MFDSDQTNSEDSDKNQKNRTVQQMLHHMLMCGGCVMCVFRRLFFLTPLIAVTPERLRCHHLTLLSAGVNKPSSKGVRLTVIRSS